MNLRQLEFFTAVYEEGSITAAAERVHGTQPGLSTQIKMLEEELDQALFSRSVGGVEPTEAGRRLYGHALSILQSVEESRIDMENLRGVVSGFIRFGLVPSAVRGLSSGLFAKFVDAYPDVRIEMKEAYSYELTQSVRAGDLDFAVVIEPPDSPGLRVEKLSDELMVLISSKKSKRKRWEEIDLNQSGPLKLVVPSLANGLRHNIEPHIKSGAITAKALLEMDSAHASIDFVKSSDWCTILPATAVAGDFENKDIVLNPIRQPTIKSDFFLVHQAKTPLSIASQSFVDVMKSELDLVAQHHQNLF